MGYGYEDLHIYKQSLNGVKSIHNLLKHPLLKGEFSLKDQIMRASMSIVANIAEGYGRHSRKDFHQFISIALGSTNEVQAFLDIIANLYPDIDINQARKDYQLLGKQIFSFRQSLT